MLLVGNLFHVCTKLYKLNLMEFTASIESMIQMVIFLNDAL